jgi:hypothetical protein
MKYVVGMAIGLALAALAYAWHGRRPQCAPDALADRYAAELSRNWGAALTAALVTAETSRFEQLGHSLDASQRERLTQGYGRLVEKFYAKDVWLPGVSKYVETYLSHDEQCAALEYYRTDVGRKVFQMQVSPGELEFVRQQATNARRDDPQFATERLEMLRKALPEIDRTILVAVPSP